MEVTFRYDQFVTMAGLMVASILPPAGKETVIPVGIAPGIPWPWMALSIAMVDIGTGLFMARNFDLPYRIPVPGKILADFYRKNKDLSQEPSVDRAPVIHWDRPHGDGAGTRKRRDSRFGCGKAPGQRNPSCILRGPCGALIGCFGIAL